MTNLQQAKEYVNKIFSNYWVRWVHTPSLMFVSSTSKVAVDFCYNKESLSFTSGKCSQLDGYVGARVNVAFSPVYKQVMFLANNNEIK